MRDPMNLEQLKYIKNVSHLENGKWAYKAYGKSSYFPLNFREGRGVEANAMNLKKGDLIILSQNYRAEQSQNAEGTRYLSHVVEVVNEWHEDRPQWRNSEWGIVRWVKVVWANADPEQAPLDAELKRDWGWQNTQAKSLKSPSLMGYWQSLDTLQAHLKKVFI